MSAAMPRRDEPTPGSTTTRKIGAGRKIAIARGQLERAGQHVVRGNVVADVDQRRVGTHAEHDALEGAGVMIASAEIGEESDGRPGHRAGLSVAAGLRNNISRTLLFIRNESVTRRSLNSLMMSPFSRLRWRGRDAG